MLALTGEAGRAARALGRGSAAAGRPARASGARPRRPGQAARRGELDELADRAEQVCRADRSAPRRREDHRPARLARRPGRAPDPQGQARQAQRVRLRRPALRAHPEHASRGARGLILPPRHPDRHPDRGRCSRDRRRARASRPPLREVALDGGFAPARQPDTRRPAPDVSSPAASNPDHDAPTAACRATASAPKAASATSNAATASTAPASRPRRRQQPGPAGGSSPTTSTPSPSRPADRSTEKLPRTHPSNHPKRRTAAPSPGAAVLTPGRLSGGSS